MVLVSLRTLLPAAFAVLVTVSSAGVVVTVTDRTMFMNVRLPPLTFQVIAWVAGVVELHGRGGAPVMVLLEA